MSEPTIKYLQDGQEVELLEKTSHGAIIRRLYEDLDDDEKYSASPELVDKVFDTPPVARQQKTIEELEATIEIRRGELTQLNTEIQSIESASKSLREKFAKYSKLNLLLAFLDGKLTHFVKIGYSTIEITEAKSETSEYGHRGEIRLLSLFGRSNGNLLWKLNHYGDGSGGWTEVIPATSYEEAFKFAQGYLADAINSKDKLTEYDIKNADDFGVPIPVEKRRNFLELKIAYLQAASDKWHKSIDEWADLISETHRDISKL